METVSTTQLNQCSTLKPVHTKPIDFKEVLPPQELKVGALCFVSTPDQFLQACQQAAGIIVLEKISSQVDLNQPQINIWTTGHIQQAMTQVLPLFDRVNLYKNQPLNAVNGSFISPLAKIGQNVHIGPFCVIEDHAIIEDNCFLSSHVHIGHHAHVKSGTRLFPHVFVGAYCEIGKNCWISANTTIGSDGFGFFTDKQNNHHKIPQIGKVVIEDNVEVGSQCAFDRATLTETRIQSGTKFDNFCHVAHNCHLGENGLYTAGFIVAGSTIVGRNVTTAGGTHITGHVKICDNVLLTGRTGVINNIDKPGAYGGFPHTDHRTNIKIMSSLESLPKMRKQLSLVLKHLGLNAKE